MKKIILLSTAASALFATSAFAQSNDSEFVSTTDAVTANSAVFGNTDTAVDQAEDIQEEIADNIASGNDANRYASSAFAQGFRGSIAGSVSFVDGEESYSSGTLGANFSHGAGPWNQSATIAATYTDGDRTNSAGNLEAVSDFNWSASYDVSRDFTPRIYGYGQLRGSQIAKNYDSPAEEKSYDFFGGVGVGYRIFAEQDLAWRVQGAVGYRASDVEVNNMSQTGADFDEIAGIVESKLYYAFNDQFSLTNDTSVLYSDSDTETVNELGLNYQMSGPLSLRAAWRIQNNSDLFDAATSIDETNQITTLSVVYSLN